MPIVGKSYKSKRKHLSSTEYATAMMGRAKHPSYAKYFTEQAKRRRKK